LVATLGPKSNLKKVNRKAILDVDVPKACETILTPEAPMALRLQSNLLYGVSRVYSQQCGYVLADAQSAQNNMRALLKVIRTAQLDPDAGKARPDQLILQDDPAFLPDLAFGGFDIDLSALDLSSDATSRRSSILSQRSQQSSQSSHHEREASHLGLVLPPSETEATADVGGFVVAGEDGSSVQRGSRLGSPLLEGGEEGFLPDADFEFDAEGNVIELTADERAQRRSGAGAGGSRLSRDSAASVRVRREHEEGLQAFARLELGRPQDLDMDMANLGDDYNIPLPDVEPFPQRAPSAAPGAGVLESSPEAPEEEDPSSESAEAPLRARRRAPKVLEKDETPELRNADLTQWNNEYLDNMAGIVRSRQHYRIPAQAKKNAAFWVMGTGVGGVGSGIGMSKMDTPLNMFSGDILMEALTGIETAAAGRKRSRSVVEEGQGSESEERRVRPREDDDEQIGHSGDLAVDDSGMTPVFDDDGIEVGREHVSSQMPWNITASVLGSRHGSSVAQGRGFPSSIGGFPTSAGGPSSARGIEGGPTGSLSRRVSRLTSASPLVGRGLERLSSLELPEHGDQDELLEEDDQQVSDEFERLGPAANVDTQTAAQSQWTRASLDQESSNFLDFIKDEINSKRPPEDDDEDVLAGDTATKRAVRFGELLPPAQHTKLVAAQALHHVLALATKTLINVQQDEGYGPIILSLVAET
ncbi:MAG: hypothetical protein M1830_000588, partial [Pleopsidium flavum]